MKLFLSSFAFFILAFGTSFSQDGAVSIASFTTAQVSTSYPIPPFNPTKGTQITSVLVRIWGAGGSGTTPNGSNKANGGGGGAYVTFVIPSSQLTISRNLTITVGEPGSVGVSGGLSRVIHNSIGFIANGGNTNGNGGTSSSNPSANYTQFSSFAGGVASSNGNSGWGAGGGSGGLYATGGSGSGTAISGIYAGGAGAAANFGTGGAGTSAGTASNNGTFPGGGGSGNAVGARGAVYIYDFSTGALPVTLSSFTAKQTTDNNVSLAWVTSSESVNKGFSIERQEESSGKFQSLGFIPSKAEGGNSQSTLAYSFKDVTAKKGTNMYRLVQEDLDGKKTYSEVRVVKLSAQSVSNVFPNPSNGDINISRTNDGKKMNLQVLDQSGRVISQANNIVDANYKLNLPQPGIYSIKMMYPETGEQSIQRIVVQK